MEIQIRVTPNAKKTEMVSLDGNIFKIRIASPPVDGKANEALINYLSKTLKIAKRRIRLISGETSRLKRISIDDLSYDDLIKTFGF